MNAQQSLAFAIIGLTMVMFAWGRVRYDLVALLALLASVAVGIVPADRAFSGFADDVVVIVASALVVSAAVARSGVVEVLFRGVLPFLTTINRQVVVLVSSVTLVSALVKNIGALATFMPVAFQLERRTGTPVSKLLMPMSFGSLLGGLMTLIGTSPNIHRLQNPRAAYGAAIRHVRLLPRGCLHRSRGRAAPGFCPGCSRHGRAAWD